MDEARRQGRGEAATARTRRGGEARRSYYYAARPEVLHFRRKPRWYQNPRAALIVVVVGGTAAVTIYYGNLETVPYTKRRHFVLVSPAVERQLGESQFEQLKAALRGKILPALHPDSIRVRLISKEIIQALQRGLRHDDRRWSDLEYASESPEEFDTPERARDTIWALSGKEEGKWSREDEVLDDRAGGGEARKSQPVTKHLEGLNWEILVVRHDTVNAFCLPGGKIVGFTGLLDHFRSDAEIATVIGHEVAHAIARHSAEMITKNLWFATLQLILLQFFAMPDLISAMSNLLLRLPLSRRMEMEADYIGLLLLASSGYDPRVAPRGCMRN
ncbi:Peptidase family M48 [Musa troglodytarum]|uniref:Peptidase family M48 n=1 Tax=Musa troglodytarum TaxID=320322 RepID=A0A9E7KA57_9LILI|nr:Peptidase family M48 [Musa troglodytarum]